MGLPFGEAWRYFERATPLGVLTAGGEVLLSPEDSLVLAKGDEVVLLADTAQACRARRGAFRPAEAPDAAAVAAQPAERLAPKRLLLLGWNPKMPDLLAQIDEVSPPGSTITILSQPGADPPRNAMLRRCRVEQVEADPTRVEDLRQLDLGKIDSILILQVARQGPAHCQTPPPPPHPSTATPLHRHPPPSHPYCHPPPPHPYRPLPHPHPTRPLVHLLPLVWAAQEGGGGEVQDSRSLACVMAVQEALRREGIAAPAGPRLVAELVIPPTIDEPWHSPHTPPSHATLTRHPHTPPSHATLAS